MAWRRVEDVLIGLSGGLPLNASDGNGNPRGGSAAGGRGVEASRILTRKLAPLDDVFLSRARRAARKVARRVGSRAPNPTVLYRSRRVCILLPSSEIVARDRASGRQELRCGKSRARSLTLSHRARRSGRRAERDNVVGALYRRRDVGRLWPHIRHVKADYEDNAAVAERRRRIATYMTLSPLIPANFHPLRTGSRNARRNYATRTRCRRSMPRDRAFLLREPTTDQFDRSPGSTFSPCTQFTATPHMGNVFITSAGAFVDGF